MRTLLQVSMPTDAANKFFMGDPNSLKKFEDWIVSLKAEAAYFTANDMGERSAFFVIDLVDPSKIPVIAEPVFAMFNARVKFRPLMTWADTKKGLEEVQRTMPH